MLNFNVAAHCNFQNLVWWASAPIGPRYVIVFRVASSNTSTSTSRCSPPLNNYSGPRPLHTFGTTHEQTTFKPTIRFLQPRRLFLSFRPAVVALTPSSSILRLLSTLSATSLSLAPSPPPFRRRFTATRPSAMSTPAVKRPGALPVTYGRVQALESPTAPPENELSIFKVAKEVLSSVKPGSDVTNINLPASVLDPVSTLEKTRKSMQRGELVQDMCDPTSDSLTRLLNVIRFNVSGLARERFGKKPYNPILGEVYHCCFQHRGSGGRTLLVAEQVSHHPPITALHLRNDTLGFELNSYTKPEPRFWGNSLEVKLPGSIVIRLDRSKTKTNDNNSTTDNTSKDAEVEHYVITRPYLYMTGFIAGRQRLEFSGTSTFRCTATNLGAEIEYKARSGLTTMAYRANNEAVNMVSGRIFRLDSGATLYTLEGHWDRVISMVDATSGERSVLFDYEATVLHKSMISVEPEDKQLEESFSTLVWRDCSKAILAGETVKANAEKRRVEEVQRKLRKERSTTNIQWQHHYFTKVDPATAPAAVADLRASTDSSSSNFGASQAQFLVADDAGNVNYGYDLRPDIKKLGTELVQLALPDEEVAKLKSGEKVEEMMEKMAAEEEANGHNDSGRKSIFRRRILSRNR